jgi:hypothetical protein
MTKAIRLSCALIVSIAVTCLCGCLCDSIEPWLLSDSIMKSNLDLEGDWEIVNEDFRDKYSLTLEKTRDQRTIEQQRYYIGLASRDFNNRFNFIGVVHEVNGIKLVQVTNFTHYHYDVFSLANRPTVSLWQIAYDDDNIVLWAPAFLREGVAALRTMLDSEDDPLFVDTTDNLQSYIEDWTENYPQMKNDINMILPVILTRAGTEFKMPEEMRDLVPKVYDGYLEEERNNTRPPAEDPRG